VVTGAGLSLEGKRWIETDPGFLLHHGVVEEKWQNRNN
jgi:hypothetical protein